MFSRKILLFIAVLIVLTQAKLSANDTGVLEFFLNLDASLPAMREAISPQEAEEAVKKRIADIREGRTYREGAMEAYWTDFRTVLEKYNEISSAKAVLIDKPEGESRVARYLVGVKVNGAVGGFFTVDPADGSIQSDLMWTSELKPLWILPASIWEKAASVNDIPYLEELLPPYSQFTTGIPVNPLSRDFRNIDGVVNEMPLKTQEERKERVNWFNATHGTTLKVALKAHKGRRTATSKCMSVAASYIADWWTERSGREQGSYTNPVGGQKEYGFNPRLLECLFFSHRKKAGLLGKFIGNFKTAPMSKDRVTGEPVPYSPRGYARVLTETDETEVKDNLVPSLLSYNTRDNHFSMDQKPLLFQIFTTGYFPRKSIENDVKSANDDDFPFSIPDNHGAGLSVSRIAEILDTWGPILGQHMGRNEDGSPKNKKFGMGVHCVMVIGTGKVDGKDMLLYAETFGNTSPDYLEDSFMGPSFRTMPLDYFYQAIVFPHHLYLKLDSLTYADDASLVGTLEVRTNRRRDPVNVDEIQVFVDGKLAEQCRTKSLGEGKYRLWMPISVTAHSKKIEIRAAKKYFADSKGRNGFGIMAIRPEKKWNVKSEQLEAITIDL